jgi:hypothetical protein
MSLIFSWPREKTVGFWMQNALYSANALQIFNPHTSNQPEQVITYLECQKIGQIHSRHDNKGHNCQDDTKPFGYVRCGSGGSASKIKKD